MPQPRSRPAARRATANKPTAAKQPAPRRKPAAAKQPAATRRKSAAAPKRPAAGEFSGKTVAEFREAFQSNILNPLNLVMLTRDRIQEALDDAVSRGRMTRADANDLVQGLVRRGRKQTEDVLSDLEQLLGRGSGLDSATRAVGKQVDQATRRALRAPAVDRAVREADRARRAAGVGPSFPVTGYDRLTAAQVAGRLGDLTPAELRKVRDHERRHRNRKSVLAAIAKRLG